MAPQVTATCSVCVQWLQQMEEMETALQRKMVDLESEKVGGCLAMWPAPWHHQAGPQGRDTGPLCFRSCSVNRRATWTRSWTTGSRPWTRLTR